MSNKGCSSPSVGVEMPAKLFPTVSFMTPAAIASAEGLSFDHVVQRLGNKYSREDLKRHIEELCDQGLLYYTNQLDRWKSTDE